MSDVREAHVMTDENGNQIAVEPFDIKGFAKKHWKKGVAALVGGGLAGAVLYLSGGRDRAIKRDSWAEFDGLVIKDVDTVDFVLKHLKPIDRFDPYAITNAVLWTHGIYEGFGGTEKIPEGNWKFFK